MLFVSHDLAVVKSISDEIMVLKEGEIVEKIQQKKFLITLNIFIQKN